MFRAPAGAFYGVYLMLLTLECQTGGSLLDERCLVGRARISVRTTTLSIGDTVTFRATLGRDECLPAGAEPAEWRWSSGDTGIATIDSITGHASAVSPGTSVIHVVHAREPGVASGVGLQVTSP